MSERRRGRNLSGIPSSTDATPKRPRKKPRIRRGRNPELLRSSSSSVGSVTDEPSAFRRKLNFSRGLATRESPRVRLLLLY